jgi:hypothetical protein
MRPSQIRKALDDLAARQLPVAPDLWPAVRREALRRHPAGGRIHIEPLGRRRGAWLPALGILLLLAALVLAPWFQRGDVPVPAATPSPSLAAQPGAPTMAVLPGAPTVPPAPLPPGSDTGDFANLLARNLGTRLGMTQPQLDAALTAAVLDTIDQAVHDGQLTPAQAAQAKARASQGLVALFRDGFAGAGADRSSNGGRALLDDLGLGPDTGAPATPGSGQ